MQTKLKQVARHVPRVLVGALLIATGVAKVLDIPGFAEVLSHYQLFEGMAIYTLIAYILPVIELAIGFSLVLRWHERFGALAAIALHLGFIAILTLTLLRGIPISNCGCFGVFLARPLTWVTILEDIVMLALSQPPGDSPGLLARYLNVQIELSVKFQMSTRRIMMHLATMYQKPILSNTGMNKMFIRSPTHDTSKNFENCLT